MRQRIIAEAAWLGIVLICAAALLLHQRMSAGVTLPWSNVLLFSVVAAYGVRSLRWVVTRNAKQRRA